MFKKLKQILAIIMTVVLVGLLSACQSDKPTAPSNTPSDTLSSQENLTSDKTGDASSTSAGTLPEYKAGSIKLEPQEQDDYSFNRKYRISYYQIWGEFVELLNEEENQDYMEWVDKKSKQENYGELQNEMLLVSFIKRYNIPREKFDQAVEKYIANSKAARCDLLSEQYEAPNGDIIYTFDNEIINRYYRYE